MLIFKEKKSKGFTLVEILVAVGIFTIITGITAGVFASAVRAQRSSLAYQQLLDQTSFAMEYMSRAIRMAKKDDVGGINCLSLDKVNFEVTHGGNGIMFRNYQDVCQEFYLENGQLKESKDGESMNLTSTSTFEVIAFNIGPDESWDQNDEEQPRVTLFLDTRGVGQKPEQKPEIKIQTTISQRNPDIKQ